MSAIARAGRILSIFVQHRVVRAALQSALRGAYRELIKHNQETRSRGRRSDIGV